MVRDRGSGSPLLPCPRPATRAQTDAKSTAGNGAGGPEGARGDAGARDDCGGGVGLGGRARADVVVGEEGEGALLLAAAVGGSYQRLHQIRQHLAPELHRLRRP